MVCVGSPVICIGSATLCVESEMVCVGSTRLFGYQNVGITHMRFSHWGSGSMRGRIQIGSHSGGM